VASATASATRSRLTKARLVILVVLFAVAAGVFATFKLLPRRYWVAEQLSSVAVFWREDEAFVFVDHHATARSTNAVTERIPQDSAWGTMASMYFDWRPLGQTTTAYRVAGRALERYELPNTAGAPVWDIEDGRLVARGRSPMEKAEGFRWTGAGFERLPFDPTAATRGPATRVVPADDDEDADARALGPISTEAGARLKGGGWHFKHLNGYEAVRRPLSLDIPLRSQSCTLSLRTTKTGGILLPFATTVELAGDGFSPRSRVLFDAPGWGQVSRAEYEARAARSPWPSPSSSFPTSALVLLLLWLAILILRVGGVSGLAGVSSVFGLKRRLVKAVGTTMTFPPTIPEQFPRLDRERLDALSRELEGLGFEKLLDTSPVTDAATSPPTFCRIYAHRRHGCYGILIQSFPQLGPPTDLRCMLNAYLDDGWSVGYGNGRPMAASALVRRPRAIGVVVPPASPTELLAGFLQFRERVGNDLGVRPIADTSLETYIRRTVESLDEIREAMKKKNMAVGMGQFWSRAVTSWRAKPQHVWLGDYPKVAEERRSAGLGPGFTAAALFE